MHEQGTATHKHGRNIDWLVAGQRAPTWGVSPCVIPGTDNVGVEIKLKAVDANTLGVQMEQPAQILIDKSDKEAKTKHKEGIS